MYSKGAYLGGLSEGSKGVEIFLIVLSISVMFVTIQAGKALTNFTSELKP